MTANVYSILQVVDSEKTPNNCIGEIESDLPIDSKKTTARAILIFLYGRNSQKMAGSHCFRFQAHAATKRLMILIASSLSVR